MSLFLQLTMTLILTAVLFDTQSTPKPYLTYLDRYILVTYAYMTLVMVENAAMGFMDRVGDGDWDVADVDMCCWIALVVLFIVQHVVFSAYAIVVRFKERRKIFMGYEEVKEFNKQSIHERQKFRLFDSECKVKGLSSNKYKRCLVISGAQWPR